MSEPLPPTSFTAPEVSHLAALFPGYEIESLIATGGMGAVYCATQRSLDRTVAIKILPPELSADAAFRSCFEAEAKAMARLNHPNLIGVYDSGEVGGMLYLIMEFVPGQSIHHSVHGIAIDPLETIRLVSSICRGLAHAHENGIIHRDIKPANILLDLNAQPKIGDFGLARPHDQQAMEGDEIFGTPHYTAPEVTSPPYSVCHRADIFPVGVMLHELLTGRLPAEDPRPASAIARCDPRFDAIIRRATRDLPEHRYSSAAGMAADLEAIATAPLPKTAPPTARMGASTTRMGIHSPQAPTSDRARPNPAVATRFTKKASPPASAPCSRSSVSWGSALSDTWNTKRTPHPTAIRSGSRMPAAWPSGRRELEPLPGEIHLPGHSRGPPVEIRARGDRARRRT